MFSNIYKAEKTMVSKGNMDSARFSSKNCRRAWLSIRSTYGWFHHELYGRMARMPLSPSGLESSFEDRRTFPCPTSRRFSRHSALPCSSTPLTSSELKPDLTTEVLHSLAASANTINMAWEREVRIARLEKLIQRRRYDAALLEILHNIPNINMKAITSARLPQIISVKCKAQRKEQAGVAPAHEQEPTIVVTSLLDFKASAQAIFSVKHFNILLDALGRDKRDKQAVLLYSWMKQCGIIPDIATFAIMMNMYLRLRRPQEALSVYSSFQRSDSVNPNAYIYSALIRTYGMMKQPELACGVLDEMIDAQSIEPNVVIFNSVLQVCVDARRSEDVMRYYHDMKTHGLRGDINTFCILIHACSLSDDIHGAFQWLNTMRQAGLRPNRACYGALMNVCSKSRQPERAFSVLVAMKRDKVEADITICNILIDAYGRARMVDRAFGVVQLIHDLGLRPSAITLNSLLSACARSMDLSRAHELFALMLRRENTAKDIIGIQNELFEPLSQDQAPSLEVVEALKNPPTSNTGRKPSIPSSRESSHMKSLQDLLKQTYCGPNVRSFNIMIHMFALNGQHEQAFQYLKLMTARSIRPSLVTYNSLLHACSRAGNMSLAYRLYMDMRRDKVSPDQITLNSLVLGYCNSGQISQAEILLTEFGSLGILPDRITMNILIHAFVKSERITKAWSLVQVMEKNGISPDHCTIRSLSTHCGSHVKDLLELIEKYSIRTHLSTFSVMIESCLKQGADDDGIAIYEYMMKDRLTLDSTDRPEYAFHPYPRKAMAESVGISYDRLANPDIVQPHQIRAQAPAGLESKPSDDAKVGSTRGEGVGQVSVLSTIDSEQYQRGELLPEQASNSDAKLHETVSKISSTELDEIQLGLDSLIRASIMDDGSMNSYSDWVE